MKQRLLLKVGAAALTLLGVLALAWNTRYPADPFMGSAVHNPPFPSVTYSIQAFLWWDANNAGLQLDWANLMAFSHVKQTFAWRDMEPERGLWSFVEADRVVQQATDYGVKLIVRLGQSPAWATGITDLTLADDVDYPPQKLEDWANFCRTVAERYQGRIHGYQIWNEPNLSREWGNHIPNAVEYTALLGACSTAIREVDSAAILISAGLAPTGNQDDTAHRDDIYLAALYEAGFQQYIDVVGVHATGYAPPSFGPDDAEREGRGRWATFRRIEDLRKIMVQYGDAARQMAILEMGWTTDSVHPEYAWFAVTEAQQAAYLEEAFRYIRDHWSPWVGLVSIIYLPKTTWTEDDEEYWWAIARPNYYARPAFGTLVEMPKYCGSAYLARRLDESEAGIHVSAGSCP